MSDAREPLRFTMARNLKMFFDRDGTPKARGPSSEKILMAFLETDVQGSDHICHDLMDDITAIEDESAESREFVGNAHCVVITAAGVTIERNIDDVADDDDTESVASKPNDDEAHANADGNVNVPPSKQPHPTQYQTGLKHFREVLEDWEAFILDDLDDQSPA